MHIQIAGVGYAYLSLKTTYYIPRHFPTSTKHQASNRKRAPFSSAKISAVKSYFERNGRLWNSK